MTAVVLSTQGLTKNFGGITATDNVSLELRQGARHALIGPNGAGKTTLINLLTGVLEPSSGSITHWSGFRNTGMSGSTSPTAMGSR